jgi:hypothetical protein
MDQERHETEKAWVRAFAGKSGMGDRGDEPIDDQALKEGW